MHITEAAHCQKRSMITSARPYILNSQQCLAGCSDCREAGTKAAGMGDQIHQGTQHLATYEINDGAATSTDYSAESNSHSEHQLTVPTSRMVGLPLLSMKR